jgi:hypothetical protein
MFELIDALDMKEGEMYFVKKKEYIMGELIFVNYKTHSTGKQFATFTFPYMSGYTQTWLNIISIYRYVSQEEYWTKVKQKYDSTCLDIVLKRVVNEHFEW